MKLFFLSLNLAFWTTHLLAAFSAWDMFWFLPVDNGACTDSSAQARVFALLVWIVLTIAILLAGEAYKEDRE